MKKIVLIAFVLLFINIIQAYEIGYVIRSSEYLNSREIALKNFLVEEGHQVTFLQGVSDLNSYDLIIISSEVNSINFNNRNKGTLFMSTKAAQNSQLSKDGGVSSHFEVRIDKIDYITNLFPLGDRRVYNSQTNINYLKPIYPSPSKNLVIRGTDRTKSVILAVDKNAELLDGTKLAHRNVFFGLTEVESWNDDARELFRRSIEWIMIGELVDNDKDGYYSIASGGNDCNDNDEEVNPGSSNMHKNCKNDAPVITGFGPDENPLVPKFTAQEFSISFDDENKENISVEWKVNNENVGSGTKYVFNKNVGNYLVSAIISDGEFSVKKEWNVLVIDPANFQCSVTNGYICTEKELCPGISYSSIDSKVCCNVPCIEKPLTFEKADKICEQKNSNIELTIEDINNILYTGDEIDFNVNIHNKLSENTNFKVYISLYDLTKDKVVYKEKKSLAISSGQNSLLTFTMVIPDILDENNEFAFYSYVEGDGKCSSNYKKLNIDRKTADVRITQFNFDDKEYKCEENIEFNVSVKNFGTEDKEVYLNIYNDDLGISYESESFVLEKYGNKNSEDKKFVLKIPEGANEGEYTISADVVFDNEVFSTDKTIKLGKCDNENNEEDATISDINEENNSKKSNNYILLMVYAFIFIFGLLISYLTYKRR